MLTQPPLRELYTDATPRPTRSHLPPLPVLLVTGVSANLTGDLRGRKSVAEVLVLLMDNAANLTAYDRELVRRLYEIACENY